MLLLSRVGALSPRIAQYPVLPFQQAQFRQCLDALLQTAGIKVESFHSQSLQQRRRIAFAVAKHQ